MGKIAVTFWKKYWLGKKGRTVLKPWSLYVEKRSNWPNTKKVLYDFQLSFNGRYNDALFVFTFRFLNIMIQTPNINCYIA